MTIPPSIQVENLSLLLGKDVTARPLLQNIGNSKIDLNDINSVKNALSYSYGESSARVRNITDTIYFEGDYSKTFDYCYSLQPLDPSQPLDVKYNLYSNNCFQVSAQAMAVSNPLFGKVEGIIPNRGYLKVLSIPRSMPKSNARQGAGGKFSSVLMLK